MLKKVIAGIFILVTVVAQAQLNRGGVPWSFALNETQSQRVDLVVPPPDLNAVAAEDLLSPIPFRFAVNLPVDAGISGQLAVGSGQNKNIQNPVIQSSSDLVSGIGHRASGIWTTLPSGDRIWSLTLQAPGAKAITLYFDRFNIPSGGRLYVYNSDRSKILGAFTEMNNSSSGLFATALIPGDLVTLEYNQPASHTELPELHISEIAYAYRGIPELTNRTGFGSSGPCEVNIHCEEGNLWQDQQKGIARIEVKKGGSSYWCSGSLVNNTRQDKTPYMLTADHCGTGCKPSDYNQWIFYFNYNSPTCPNPLDEPGFMAMTGTEVKAAAGEVNIKGSDFLLLQLNQTIPDSFNVWFNGWNREDISSPSGVGIHHPMGDIKKISTYTKPLVDSNWSNDPDKTHWMVTWSETLNGHGVTEGGSSGSPIFDPQGRIVGALTGGEALCDSAYLNSPDFYGKFSYSWDLNGPDNNERLDVWLDPDNTGVMVLDGIPLNIPDPEATSSDLNIYPNPTSGILNLKSALLQNQGTIRIDLTDSWGRGVASYTSMNDNSGQFTLDISSLPNGFYLIRISSEEFSVTGRIIKL